MVKNLSIKFRLGLIIITAVMAIGGVFGLQRHYLSTIEKLMRAEILIETISKDILMLRRNEKDFLARKNLKYYKNFQENYQRLNEDIDTQHRILTEQDIDVQKIKELKGVLREYSSDFITIVSVQKKIGLDEKSGLYGALRTSAHNLEKLFETSKNDRLLKEILTLRRNEKDFMLKNNLKYVVKHDKNLEILMNDLLDSKDVLEKDKQKGSELINAYRKEFLALVEGYKEKGLTHKQGVLGKMREAVHNTDAILDETSNTLRSTISKRKTISNTTSLIVSIIAVLLSLLITFVVSKGILKQLGGEPAVIEEIALKIAGLIHELR